MSKPLNASQLAAAIGKSRQTVHNWAAEGLPRRPDKNFDLPAVISWMIEREKDAMLDQVDASGCASPELERWRKNPGGYSAIGL